MSRRYDKVGLWLARALVLILAGMIATSGWNLFVLSQNYCLNSDEGFIAETAGHCGVDMDQYVDSSDSLMAGAGYSAKIFSGLYGLGFQNANFYIPETNRMPGLPVLLTILREVNPARRMLYYFNLASLLVIIAGSGWLTKRRLGTLPALLMMLWLVNNEQLRFWVLGGNADIVATAIYVVFSFVLLELNKSWLQFLALFVLATCGVFLRSNTFLLFLPLFVSVVLVHRRWSLLVPMVGVVLCLAAWSARNGFVSGRATLSTNSGHQLLLEYPLEYPMSEESQWYTWYSGSVYRTIGEVKAGVDVSHAWAATDSLVGQKAWAWIFSHLELACERFRTGWVRILDSATLGELKPPLEWLAAPAKSCAYAIVMLVALIVAAIPLTRSLPRTDYLSIAVLSLSGASFIFLIVSNFWHGDWIGVRGSLEVIPSLIFLQLYLAVVFIKKISRRLALILELP